MPQPPGEPEVAFSARSLLHRLRSRRAVIAYDPRWEPGEQPEPSFAEPVSQACTAAQIADPAYARWCERFRTPQLCHRKQWEWCYIAQALDRAGVVGPGRRGLGFGVGTEPLVATFASMGAEIVATDLASDASGAQRWAETGQHADAAGVLNRDELCPADVFARAVSFRAVDMNAVPDDLGGFDFTWSSCALEHLGDLDAGAEFLLRQIACLRPGGVGVHTTEYNVSSNASTVGKGHTVFYRRKDIEALQREVRGRGHEMVLTFGLGSTDADRHVDREPWSNTHLKIQSEGHVITSFGLILRRAGIPSQ